MLALLLAILGALLLSSVAKGKILAEGTFRISGILSSVTFAKLGRVHIGVWSYRPGRVYVRLGVA